MSLVAQINQALNDAREALGDLVLDVTLRRTTAKVYNTATGTYTSTPVDVQAQGVMDQFTFTEMNAPNFDANQVKFTLFNPNNDLVVTPADFLIISAVQYPINKILKNYVGSTVPVFTLYLRK